MFKKSSIISLFAIVFCAVIVSTASALVPPWFDIDFGLSHTVGLTPGITIEEPVETQDEAAPWLTNIVVDTQKDGSKALQYALTKIIPTQMGFLKIKIVDENRNTITESDIDKENDLGFSDDMNAYEKTKILLDIAYKNNPYYLRTEIQENGFSTSVIAIMKPEVIQYYRDALSAYKGMGTYVAADLFRTYMNPVVDNIYTNASTEIVESPIPLL